MRRHGREARHLNGDLQGARGARRRDDGLTQCAVRDLVEDHLQLENHGRKRGSYGIRVLNEKNVGLIYGKKIPDTWSGILFFCIYIYMLVYDMYVYISK